MSTNAIFRLVVDWLPFLIFLGLMIFFLRKTGFGARQVEYMAFMQRYCNDHLEATRKISESLQRIASALEKSRNS